MPYRRWWENDFLGLDLRLSEGTECRDVKGLLESGVVWRHGTLYSCHTSRTSQTPRASLLPSISGDVAHEPKSRPLIMSFLISSEKVREKVNIPRYLGTRCRVNLTLYYPCLILS